MRIELDTNLEHADTLFALSNMLSAIGKSRSATVSIPSVFMNPRTADPQHPQSGVSSMNEALRNLGEANAAAMQGGYMAQTEREAAKAAIDRAETSKPATVADWPVDVQPRMDMAPTGRPAPTDPDLLQEARSVFNPEPQPEPAQDAAGDGKPKRTRRTKAQIEADELAAKQAQDTQAKPAPDAPADAASGWDTDGDTDTKPYAGMDVADPEPAPASDAKTLSVPEMRATTLDMLRLCYVADNGGQAKVEALQKEYGVKKFSELPDTLWATLMPRVEKLYAELTTPAAATQAAPEATPFD